jgi:C4-type Zn-finger protein
VVVKCPECGEETELNLGKDIPTNGPAYTWILKDQECMNCGFKFNEIKEVSDLDIIHF